MKELDSIRAVHVSLHIVPFNAFIIIIISSLLLSSVSDAAVSEQDGFVLEDIQAADRPETLECPSSNVITTRYKCHMNGQWVDCFRKHCCLGYTLIAGQCIPDDQDPCSLGLCEQKCSTFFGRVVCTCFHGYKFDSARRKLGLKPYCIDTNECSEANGGCDHECANTDGGFQCSCRSGYVLKADNLTCQETDDDQGAPSNVNVTVEVGSDQESCLSSCTVVGRLQDRVRVLEEKIQALSTAIQIYSFGSGPPGPEGPPGEPGQVGPRGFPGQEGAPGAPGVAQTALASASGRNRTSKNRSRQNDYHYYDDGGDEEQDGDDVLVPVNGDQKHCQCKRGPIGPPGAPGSMGQRGEKGEDGLKGDKGDEGALDFLLLMIADIRWDIKKLQEKVFVESKPVEFELPKQVEISHQNENTKSDQKESTTDKKLKGDDGSH